MIEGEFARDRMIVELYGDLRLAAARMLRREAASLRMQPTELANEAALRLMKLDQMSWVDKQHFFATGARVLRQAMLDEIRKDKSAKRQPATLPHPDSGALIDIEALDDALVRLEVSSPELTQIVELRFYVGLGMEEIAAITDQSESTIKRRWKTARLWLADALQDR